MCDWHNIASIMSGSGIAIFIFAVALYSMKYIVDAIRAGRVIRVFGVEIPFFVLLRINIQAIAFDFVLPIPQAEEVYRFGKFAAYSTRKTALLLVVAIRSTGLVATVFTLGLTLFFTTLRLKPVTVTNHPYIFTFVLIDIVVTAILAGWYILRRHRRDPEFLRLYMDKLQWLLDFFQKHKIRFAESVVLGLVAQCIYAAVIYTFILCNNASISYFSVYLIIPLIYFGGLVPVGIAGLGIKEAVIAWALEQSGIPSAIAWNVALFHLVLMLFYTALGAFLFASDSEAIKDPLDT